MWQKNFDELMIKIGLFQRIENYADVKVTKMV